MDIRIEVMAADIAARGVAANDGHDVAQGWNDHASQSALGDHSAMWCDRDESVEYQAGWLAREISTHEVAE